MGHGISALLDIHSKEVVGSNKRVMGDGRKGGGVKCLKTGM